MENGGWWRGSAEEGEKGRGDRYPRDGRGERRIKMEGRK